MAIPVGAVVPFGIITVLFGASAVLLGGIKMYQHGGKAPRYSLDNWDKAMMERDRRLTGSSHVQTDEVVAPKEFSYNSVWTLLSSK